MAVQTLGGKIDERLGHYREIIIGRAAKKFDEADLRENIDDVLVRMIEITFEQEQCADWNELIEEAARDTDIKEID